MKAKFEQYFSVALLMLYKVILTLDFMDETLK